jgi:rubrerythrin
MTMAEVHEHLKRHLADEEHDVNSYTEMAKAAKADGEDELAFWLWQIAHDEEQHRNWIRRYLGKHEEKNY